jgi:long-subunit acyl-CoA synthetase (AMP-forming)
MRTAWARLEDSLRELEVKGRELAAEQPSLVDQRRTKQGPTNCPIIYTSGTTGEPKA